MGKLSTERLSDSANVAQLVHSRAEVWTVHSDCWALAPNLCTGPCAEVLLMPPSYRKWKLRSAGQNWPIEHFWLVIPHSVSLYCIWNWNQLPILKKNFKISTLKYRFPASGRCSGKDGLLYLHGKDPPSATVPTTPYCLPDTDIQSLFPHYFTASTHCPHIHHLPSPWGSLAFDPFPAVARICLWRQKSSSLWLSRQGPLSG